MKKTAISILAAVILISCIFAACNGTNGGKITDNRQNLSDAMTEIKDMITNISEAFTNAPDTNTGVISDHPTAETVTDTATVTA